MAIPGLRRFTSPILADGFLFRKYRKQGMRVINKTGSDIAANKLVAIVGFDTTEGLPKVVLADADDPAHTDVYVSQEVIANNGLGHVYKGFLSTPNLDTSSVSTAGDPVYLSTTAGAFTATAPTAPEARVQIVGYATVDSASVGQIHWDVQPAKLIGVGSLQQNVEVVSATNVITADENGKTFFLASATEFASTLPAPFLGAHFTFIVSAAPSGASYTIVTDAAAQILVGGVHDAGGAAGDVESTLGGTTITFVDGQSVIGDRADLWSDGTNWYARIFVNVAAGATITG